jgi:hypothetical protein
MRATGRFIHSTGTARQLSTVRKWPKKRERFSVNAAYTHGTQSYLSEKCLNVDLTEYSL